MSKRDSQEADTIALSLSPLGVVRATRNKICVRRTVIVEVWEFPLKDWISGIERAAMNLANPIIFVNHEASYGDCDLHAYVEGWLEPSATQQRRIDGAWKREDASRVEQAARVRAAQATDKARVEARERRELERLKRKYEAS